MKCFDKVISMLGGEVEIHGAGGVTKTACVIQPRVSAEKNYNSATKLGFADCGRYYIILPADAAVDDALFLVYDGVEYEPLRFEKIYAMGEVSHIEGVLKKRMEEYDVGD